MLAKIWKKLLLAICIIACLFNVTSKLVNRTSLEVNLKKANDGTGILDILKEDDDKSKEVIDGVKETITENSKQENNNELNNNEKTLKSDYVILN